ncbi:MAG: hypothetical protein P8020_13245 [Acidobacteriota bacterium]|jgi:hypothetical protein
MEIGRLINVEKMSGQLPSDGAKGSAKAKKKDSSAGEQHENPKTAESGGAEGYSTPINFEYLPSGRILLNREARKQIIDFFE